MAPHEATFGAFREETTMGKLTWLAGAAALALSRGVATPRQADDDVVIGFAIALSGWMNQYDGPPSRSAKMEATALSLTT